MKSVIPVQAGEIPITAVGFNIPEGVPVISFGQFMKYCRRDRWRIWHSRRNVDMLAGLILRYLFRFKLVLVFTSAAQRHHSWFTRLLYHRMSRLIATSDAAASFLDKESVVIPHGVDIGKFSPPADRRASWNSLNLPGKFGIGVFGRIRPQKGTEEFIDAMIGLLPVRPGWTAVIVGQTTREFYSFEQKLRVKIKEAGLEDRFYFTGYLKDPDDLPDWYRSLSVVVCASRVEGFGLTCLEAMASGCPVVATRTGAWPQIVSEGEDGYLVPCNDSGAMYDAIYKITGDLERVEQMGRSAHSKVESHYRIQDEANRINEIYKQLLGKYHRFAK